MDDKAQPQTSLFPPRPRRVHIALRRGGSGAAAVLTLAALCGVWVPMQAGQAVAAPQQVSLVPDLRSGQPVGTVVTWTATATAVSQPVYRFTVALQGGPASIVRDFSSQPSFSWAPLHEGVYDVRVSVKAGYTATATVDAMTTFTLTSRITGSHAVVSPTANPLVALYSVPPCTKGIVVVMFRPAAGTAGWQTLAPQACQPGHSINMLVAGMREGTRYLLRHVVVNRTHRTTAAPLSFTTVRHPVGTIAARFRDTQVPTSQSDTGTPIVLHELTPMPDPRIVNPVATDLQGHLIWYYDSLHSGLTLIWPFTIVAGGTLLLAGQDRFATAGEDVLREIDLAGTPVRETSIGAINAQLDRLHQPRIYAFHHEAVRLPNGDTAVLATMQQTVDGRVMMGDLVVVLGADMQVRWTWNPFTHLDTNRHLGVGEICAKTYPPHLCAVPDDQAEDWLHTNAISWSPQDHNLILSLRYQDWVIKVDYDNDHGTGEVLWRMGPGGTFTIQPTNPADWFSFQHDARYLDATHVTLFDNGNSRCILAEAPSPDCHSRGQEWLLDEAHHVATLVLDVDLGGFSSGLGSAQVLTNGNFSFGSGVPYGRSIEVGTDGAVVFEQTTPLQEYRAYRLRSLTGSPFSYGTLHGS